MSSTPTESLTPYERLIFKSFLFPFFFGLFVICLFVLQMQGLISSRTGAILSTVVVLLIILHPFIVRPIRLHRNHRMSAHSDYDVIDPTGEVIPEEVWNLIQETIAGLSPCGLKIVAHFRKSGRHAGVVGFVTLMQSSGQVTVGKLSTLFTGAAVAGHDSLRFITELADGTEIVTGNSPLIPHTPRRKNKIGLWLPKVRNPRELYEFHQRLVERFGGPQKKSI